MRVELESGRAPAISPVASTRVSPPASCAARDAELTVGATGAARRRRPAKRGARPPRARSARTAARSPGASTPASESTPPQQVRALRRGHRLRRLRRRALQARIRRAARRRARARRAGGAARAREAPGDGVAPHRRPPATWSNRPANDLTPTALAAHAAGTTIEHLTVERHGRDWIESQEMGALRRRRGRQRRGAAADRHALRPARGERRRRRSASSARRSRSTRAASR